MYDSLRFMFSGLSIEEFFIVAVVCVIIIKPKDYTGIIDKIQKIYKNFHNARQNFTKMLDEPVQDEISYLKYDEEDIAKSKKLDA
jgi:Sec-independent protein translocase protein TatA